MSTLVIVLAAALAADADLAITSRSIVRQTNQFRRQHELQPVRTNHRLQRAADYFAGYLARHDQLDHEADGSTPAERAEKYGYEYCMVLENIADEYNSQGFQTDELAQSLVSGWEGSRHHRENMLDADVTETGVAIAQSQKSGRYYAVQMFGRPKDQEIEFSVTNESKAEVTYEIDDQEFDLPPRVTRTHGACRPVKLVMHLGKDREKSLKPHSGEHWTVLEQNGELTLEKTNE